MFGNRPITTEIPFIVIALALLAGIMIFFGVISDVAPEISLAGSQPVEIGSGFNVQRVRAAETARLNGLAGEYVNLYGSTALAGWSPVLTQAQRAEGVRLQALAGEYVNLYGSTALAGWSPVLTQAQRAEAVRLQALAGEYVNLYGSTRLVQAGGGVVLTSGHLAEAARLTAQAIAYGQSPGEISVEVAEIVLP